MFYNLFFCLLSLLLFSPAISDELQPLLAIKYALQNPFAAVFNSWNPTTNQLCNFTGITCHPDGSVQAIELSGQYLSGEVPFDSICELESLEKLSLGMNSLVGPITEDLKNCVNLKYLDLGNNFFNGTVPDLSPLNRLTSLHLNNNGFTGMFPWNSLSNMSGLVVFSVGDNVFDKMPFPKVVISLKNLKWLYMSDCNLHGSIPPGIGNLTNLKNLELADNYLEWNIPESMGQMHNLRILHLQNNIFSGEIPESIGYCVFLYDLNMANNLISGEIPFSLGSLPALKSLNLTHNQLVGPIPTVLSSLKLNILDLSYNQLSGPIPDLLYNGSFTGNEGLCSQKVAGFRHCLMEEEGNFHSRKVLGLALFIAFLVGFLVLLIACFFYVKSKRTKKDLINL